MFNKFFILIFLTSIFQFSCSQKNNILDTDLSNLPKRKKVVEITKEESNNSNENQFIKDLVPFEPKELIFSKFKIGKKDPFSESETKQNQFSADFKLTGFLNTNIEKYVFVSYLGNKGAISEESIGGLNTNLLPNGAKVIDIDTKKKQLKVSFDNEDYIFEL